MPLAFPSRTGRPGVAGAPSTGGTGATVGFGAVAAAAAFAFAVHKAAKLRSPLTLPNYKAAAADDGTVPDFEALLLHIADKGLEPGARPEVWPLLLGVYDAEQTYEQRSALYNELRASFEALLRRCQELETACLEATTSRRSGRVSSSCSALPHLSPSSTPSASASPLYAKLPGNSSRSLGDGASGGLAAASNVSRGCGLPSVPTSIQIQQVSGMDEPSWFKVEAAEEDDGPGLGSGGGDVRGGAFAEASFLGHVSHADVPPELRPYWEAQQSIALDAVRVDFKKSQLPGATHLAAAGSSISGDSSAGGKLVSGITLSLRGLGLSGLGGVGNCGGGTSPPAASCLTPAASAPRLSGGGGGGSSGTPDPSAVAAVTGISSSGRLKSWIMGKVEEYHASRAVRLQQLVQQQGQQEREPPLLQAQELSELSPAGRAHQAPGSGGATEAALPEQESASAEPATAVAGKARDGVPAPQEQQLQAGERRGACTECLEHKVVGDPFAEDPKGSTETAAAGDSVPVAVEGNRNSACTSLFRILPLSFGKGREQVMSSCRSPPAAVSVFAAAAAETSTGTVDDGDCGNAKLMDELPPAIPPPASPAARVFDGCDTGPGVDPGVSVAASPEGGPTSGTRWAVTFPFTLRVRPMASSSTSSSSSPPQCPAVSCPSSPGMQQGAAGQDCTSDKPSATSSNASITSSPRHASEGGAASRSPLMHDRVAPAAADTETASSAIAALSGSSSPSCVSALARFHLGHAAHFSPGQMRLVERLVTLLSAYTAHDPELGYCQGMSDLALPFVLLLEDDAIAFWCFVGLMDKVRANFLPRPDGLFERLATLGNLLAALDPTVGAHLAALHADHCHFAHRMVAVQMRRELSAELSVRLWEQLWADDLLEAMARRQRAQWASAERYRAAGSGMVELSEVGFGWRVRRMRLEEGDGEEKDEEEGGDIGRGMSSGQGCGDIPGSRDMAALGVQPEEQVPYRREEEAATKHVEKAGVGEALVGCLTVKEDEVPICGYRRDCGAASGAEEELCGEGDSVTALEVARDSGGAFRHGGVSAASAAITALAFMCESEVETAGAIAVSGGTDNSDATVVEATTPSAVLSCSDVAHRSVPDVSSQGSLRCFTAAASYSMPATPVELQISDLTCVLSCAGAETGSRVMTHPAMGGQVREGSGASTLEECGRCNCDAGTALPCGDGDRGCLGDYGAERSRAPAAEQQVEEVLLGNQGPAARSAFLGDAETFAPVAAKGDDSTASPPVFKRELFLYVVASVILSQRRRLLECRELDDVLRLFQSLPPLSRSDVSDVLRRAREHRDRVAPRPPSPLQPLCQAAASTAVATQAAPPVGVSLQPLQLPLPTADGKGSAATAMPTSERMWQLVGLRSDAPTAKL